MFTEQEVNYIKSQRLARIATVSTAGQPDVVPVGFDFNGAHFYIGGHNITQTRKYRNIRDGNSRVALVVDDLASLNPWNPRGVRIYGTVDVVEREGYAGQGIYLRIKPEISWSWNIEGRGARKATHSDTSENRVE